MQPGTRLGHYEILAALGKGGMGEVWRARDTKLRREVAIKTLPAALARDSDRLVRLAREATSLAAVSHPNVAVIYGLEEQGDVHFLVLELVEGETLAERLSGGRLRVKPALEIAAQIAEALEAAHERGVVHRDLKPANVKIESGGRVKVLDFGLAKSLTDVGTEHSAGSTLMTELGTVLGTAPYMSPEQTRGEAAGPQTDIWAFGVVLYEMLTGISPFARATGAETVARVLEAQPDFVLLPVDTPPSARHLVRRCLEKEQRRRVKHAGDARIAVEDALAELASGPVHTQAHAGISRRVLAGGAVLAVLGAGLGGALVARRGVEAPPAPTYQRLTFRRGMIRTARFAPDFQTILYGALWEGDVCRVYTVRPESPESAAMSLPPATPLAVSTTGELALALGTHYRGVMTYGTLARVPLAGGAPRELEENVKYADWSPDGADLAIVRRVGARDQLGLLSGAILAEPEIPGGGFSFPRFSPSGDAVAAFELTAPTSLVGRVVIVDRAGVRRAVSPRSYFNVFGLAWHGDEVWFTAAEEIPLFRNAIHAMSRAGLVRLVARVPGNTSLHEVAPSGRALIARTDDRGGITVRVPGVTAERDFSWLDESVMADISRDGSRILFSEFGVGGGSRTSTYLRATDGSPAVRLSDGLAQSLSPDGRWAIVQTDAAAPYLDVIPTGPGPTSRLERPGFKLIRARWLPDGRNLAVLAQDGEAPARLYALDIDGAAPRAITPAGLSIDDFAWFPSPDGTLVGVSTADGLRVFPVAGGETRTVPGDTRRFTIVGWIDGGLLVAEDPVEAKTVFRVDPATGRSETWADFQPGDPGGIMLLSFNRGFAVTPDGRGYGYSWHRAVSDLYLADGWAGRA